MSKTVIGPMTGPTRARTGDTLTRIADELRGFCSVVTKIARRDHQHLLNRHHTGINALEHGVLRRAGHGAETLGELSHLMTVAPSTLVYVIDRLVSKGLLTKRNDPRDRRRQRLSVTRKGRTLLAAIPTMDAQSVIVASLARMTRRQRTALRAHLRAFVAVLEGAIEWTPEFRPVAQAGAKRPQEWPPRRPGRREWPRTSA